MSHIKLLLIGAIFFLPVLSPSVAISNAGEEESYINDLIAQAFSKKLHEERFWQLLLHYRETSFSGYESEEDGPAFFVSKEGKTEPQAELVATIRSFFKKIEDLEPEEEHPQCVFPARYKWLKNKLQFDLTKLPNQRCKRLDDWLNRLNPEKITLIFASHYGNNPASMFGHTLLRVDKEREGPKQVLLDYGVNYAANVESTNAFAYVARGLFGGFVGTFSLFPYYMKVQQYNNLESRDLWEYELNFSSNQMDYMLRHLWELGGNYFDYFYFQENCSYHILSLLEVANPNLHLTNQFFFSVIPAETVKVVLKNEHIVSKRVYRPSLLNQMNNKLLNMTERQKSFFYTIAKDPEKIKSSRYESFSVSEKALILDAYLDYDQYKKMKNKKINNTIDTSSKDILLARSKLQIEDRELSQALFSTPPETGHGSSRFKIGAGFFENDSFQEVAYRPTFHDILAKADGYNKYSQILFFETVLRYYHDIDKLKLERLRLLDILSLEPYDPLFKKRAWKLNLGFESMKEIDCNFCNSFMVNYGTGISYKPSFSSSALFFIMVDLETEFSRHLQKDYRAGGGGTAGLMLDMSGNWSMEFGSRYVEFPFGHKSDYYELHHRQRISINQNMDTRFELKRREKNDEFVLSLNCFF